MIPIYKKSLFLVKWCQHGTSDDDTNYEDYHSKIFDGYFEALEGIKLLKELPDLFPNSISLWKNMDIEEGK